MSDEDNSDEEYIKKMSLSWMHSGTGRKATVKFLFNGMKVLLAINSGTSVNVIYERSAEKLYLEKMKVKVYGYASET